MDLLGSILNSMDKPPTVSDKQKELLKRQKQELLKKQNAEKEMLKRFRAKVTSSNLAPSSQYGWSPWEVRPYPLYGKAYMLTCNKRLLQKKINTEKELNGFLNDPKKTRLKYPPLDQIFRSIVHEAAEESGLTAHSFGKDGIDRYIMVFKKEYPPSEDELAVLRNGEEWNEEKEREIALRREHEREEQIEAAKRKNEKFTPNSNYQEKYQHLIGLEAAKDAARVTQTNKQYGFVPSENKKDHRSIEETLADIQRKKRKMTHNQGD